MEDMRGEVIDIESRRTRNRLKAEITNDGADVLVMVGDLELVMTPTSARRLVRGIRRELRAMSRAKMEGDG